MRKFKLIALVYSNDQIALVDFEECWERELGNVPDLEFFLKIPDWDFDSWVDVSLLEEPGSTYTVFELKELVNGKWQHVSTIEVPK